MLGVGHVKNQRPAKVSPGGPAYVLGGTSMRLGRFGNRNFGRETLNFSLRIISCNFGFLAALSSCSHLQKNSIESATHHLYSVSVRKAVSG
jgi:hypothetical protein